MGFLKFLKREKKVDMNELDLPPEPPPLEGFEDKQDFEFPEIKADDLDMPKFDDDKDTKDYSGYGPAAPEMNEDAMPNFPEFPEMEEAPEVPPEPEMPYMPSEPLAATAPVVQPMPAAPQSEMPESEPQQPRRRLFHHERMPRGMHARKEVYVRVDRFKAVLDGIGIIRSSVRKSDEALMRLESLKNSKDRAFDRIKTSLEDLQKKLIFIDKTLFKGD